MKMLIYEDSYLPEESPSPFVAGLNDDELQPHVPEEGAWTSSGRGGALVLSVLTSHTDGCCSSSTPATPAHSHAIDRPRQLTRRDDLVELKSRKD